MPDVRIPAQAVYVASLDEPKRSPWRRLVDRLPWRRNRDPFAGWREVGFLDDAEITFAFDGSRGDDGALIAAVRRASDTLVFRVDHASPSYLDLVTGRSNHVQYVSRERVAMRAELRRFERETRYVYDHAIYELAAATVYLSEAHALEFARFALDELGPEAAVAILRGWMRNPRRAS